MRDVGRARLNDTLPAKHPMIQPFQGIHTATTLAQDLRILATANTLWGLLEVAFHTDTFSGVAVLVACPAPSLVIAPFLLHLSAASPFLFQIRFFGMACLSLLSRPFLVLIAHQGHPCPAAQQVLPPLSSQCHTIRMML